MATAQPQGSRRDAVEILMADHRRVDVMFARFESMGADDASAKRSLVDDLTRDLSVHAAVEEQHFYPAVREAVGDGEQLVEESLDEHQEVKEMLAALKDMDPSDVAIDHTVMRLIGEVRHHVEEEEGELLPKLMRAVGRERMLEIGEHLDPAKPMAPTKPHPHAPNSPPGNLVAGPMAAGVDRVRDAISSDDNERDSG